MPAKTLNQLFPKYSLEQDFTLAKMQVAAFQKPTKIILLVNGVIIHATLTSPVQFHEKYLESLGDSATDEDKDFKKIFPPEHEVLTEEALKFLYLVDVIINSEKTTPLPYLRLKLTAVDGWCRVSENKKVFARSIQG